MIAVIFQWLVTYLLHSTLLLGSAALLDWRRRMTGRGISSPLWRIALFGAFISATLQPVINGFFANGLQYTAGTASRSGASQNPVAAIVLPPLGADAIDIAPLVMPIWAGVVAIGIVHLLARLVLDMRDVRGMPLAQSPPLERSAQELAASAGIVAPRLRTGFGLKSPLVAPGRIICIPAWMLEHYNSKRLHVALAHEMRHLQRHDNAWRIASRIAALVGWLQPLNRLAVRRLDETAEFACDDWAASVTGLGHELACSLQDCADRVGSSHRESAFAIGMVGGRFVLLERVVKLLEGPHMNTQGLRRAAWWSSVVLIGVGAVASFVVVSTLDDDVPPRWLASNGLYQSLRNSGQGVHTERTVIIDSPGQYVYVRVTEDFSFDGHEPATRARAGTAVIAETRAGVTRSVRYERGANNELRRTYKVDGRIHVLDAEAERWLRTMMPIAARGEVFQRRQY
jgi:beta-lactamase regulating signal transducer with metallopeptidase domain